MEGRDLELPARLRRQHQRRVEGRASQVAENGEIRRRIGVVIFLSAVNRLDRDGDIDAGGDRCAIDLQRDAKNIEVGARDLVAECDGRQHRDDNCNGR